MAENLSQKVARRRVFYIPGYDPYPARRYRELYRKEGREQARISGYRLAVRATEGPRYAWDVATEIGGARTRTRVEILEWSDIVRDTMDQSVAGTYLQLARTAWAYIASGALRRMTWLRKGPVIAGLYPAAMLLFQLFVAIIAGRIAGGLAAGVAAFVTGWLLPDLSWGWLAWVVGVPVAALALHLFRGQDRRLLAYYLMHDLAFTAKLGGAYPPELEDRIAAFAREIAEALSDDVDEVLVVGHSSGAHIAVSAVAEAIADRAPGQGGPVLSLLTLGQSIPMVSFLPKAKRLRRDLNALSRSEALVWVDVSAPGDGASFALCDPVAVSGVAGEGKRWPLVLSAAFSNTLSEDRMKALRWRYFRRHFQYLCAFDHPESYDYFAITGGPLTLGARFADRKPSASRIDVAASRHVTMAA